MNAIFALAGKDFLLFLRDRTAFIATFVSPLIYAVFLGLVLGGRPGSTNSSRTTIMVVDEDSTASSLSVIEALKDSPALDVQLVERAPALEAFRSGEMAACVIIRAGFESHVKIPGGPDPSNIEMATGRDEHLQLFHRDAPESCILTTGRAGALASKERRAPVKAARTAPANVYAIAFPQGMTWGVLGCTAAFGLSFVVERNRGTLARLRLAPISRTQVLAGKAGACFATSLLLGVAMFAISWLAFGVRPSSVALLMLALLSVSIAFVGIMTFLSVWARTEQAAGSILWATLLGMSMLGGGMVPRFLMPSSLQRLGDLSPIRWAILAMDGAVWRGFTLGELAHPCGILIAVGFSSFALGVIRFRWSD